MNKQERIKHCKEVLTANKHNFMEKDFEICMNLLEDYESLLKKKVVATTKSKDKNPELNRVQHRIDYYRKKGVLNETQQKKLDDLLELRKKLNAR